MSEPAPENVEPAICPICKKKHICRSCGRNIDHPGKLCACGTHQSWWRRFSGFFATLVPITGAIAFALTYGPKFFRSESKTSATVLSAATQAITLRVQNTGGQASFVTRCRVWYVRKGHSQELPVNCKPDDAAIQPDVPSIVEIKDVPKGDDPDVETAKVILTVQESSGTARDLPPIDLGPVFVLQLRQRF